ncbi:porin [Sodalis ligni]|uniref:porin n=1 Tax=Sodalis ligni TaxID=2697027 RepID=UPI003C7CCC40
MFRCLTGFKVYLAGLYAETHNMIPVQNLGFENKTQSKKFIAQYNFYCSLKPEVGYFILK